MEAVDRVVVEGLLSYVQWARMAEPVAYRDERIFTFQWILDDYFRVLEENQQRVNIGQEALKLVKQAISRLLSENAQGTGGSGGVYAGTHTHGSSTHTHGSDGSTS